MNRSTRILGVASLVAFFACIPLANWMVQHVGTPPAFPGGPHTITDPVFGLTAPSAVLIVGLSFSFRDGAQLALGRWPVLGAIVAGAALSWLVAPSLAVASAVAFLVGETADWLCYTPLADRGEWVRAVALSNTVGSAIDSVLFLWIAFGWDGGVREFFWPQFALKALMILPALAVVIPLRVSAYRRRVAA
jgi:uncharacterized PurR-regulated membrane protein YhhQ (DUF165 family)